jgi:hypothetical protein
MASECLEDLIRWLKAGGNVGIHGALEALLHLAVFYLTPVGGGEDLPQSVVF